MIITACDITNQTMKDGSLGAMGLFEFNEDGFIAEGITEDTSAEEVRKKYPALMAKAIARKEGMIWDGGSLVYFERTGWNTEGLLNDIKNPSFRFLNMKEGSNGKTIEQVLFVNVKKTITRTVAVSIPLGDFAESALNFIEEKAKNGEISMKEEDEGTKTEFEAEFGFEIPKKEVDFEK